LTVLQVGHHAHDVKLVNDAVATTHVVSHLFFLGRLFFQIKRILPI